jgi:hypothetical protein
MRSAPMIVVDVGLQVSVEATFLEYDHVIQALAANGANHPFPVGALSWGRWPTSDPATLPEPF